MVAGLDSLEASVRKSNRAPSLQHFADTSRSSSKSMAHKVQLALYDLSRGLAKTMSMAILGKQIDGEKLLAIQCSKQHVRVLGLSWPFTYHRCVLLQQSIPTKCTHSVSSILYRRSSRKMLTPGTGRIYFRLRQTGCLLYTSPSPRD